MCVFGANSGGQSSHFSYQMFHNNYEVEADKQF